MLAISSFKTIQLLYSKFVCTRHSICTSDIKQCMYSTQCSVYPSQCTVYVPHTMHAPDTYSACTLHRVCTPHRCMYPYSMWALKSVYVPHGVCTTQSMQLVVYVPHTVCNPHCMYSTLCSTVSKSLGTHTVLKCILHNAHYENL